MLDSQRPIRKIGCPREGGDHVGAEHKQSTLRVADVALDVDRYVPETLRSIRAAVDDEIRRYPRDEYPARGTVLISLGRRLGEVVTVAECLREFPAKAERPMNSSNGADAP